VSRQLLLLRHGRTAYNAAERFQGQADIPLDDVGRAEVARVAPLAAARRPVLIASSDSLRAADTAEAVASISRLEVLYDERLREIDVGGWSGLTLEEAAAAYPEEYALWSSGDREALRRGGGETYREVGDRAYAAVQPLLDGSSKELVLVVTHGGTARSLIDLMLGVPESARHILGGIPNAGWSRLAKGRFGWRLMEHAVTADLGAAPVP
jgi:probable phosphoglycerate mutase